MNGSPMLERIPSKLVKEPDYKPVGDVMIVVVYELGSSSL